MTEADRKLLETFWNAQSEYGGVYSPEVVLLGIKAVIAEATKEEKK